MSLRVRLNHQTPHLDFSAEIPRGQISALVGPSGSGKTTILRSIAGLLKVRRAQISLADDHWDTEDLHRPTRERPIGMMLQQHALFPHLSVRGNIEMALSHLGRREKRQRVLECLRLAQIEEMEDRRPQELSGGQRQRAALARAIARAPKLLLLDEPFTAIDRRMRKLLYLELRRLHQQLNNTVLLVTHDLDEAAQLASYLLLIDQGRLLQAGETTHVLTRPRCEQSARLLDIPNIFTALILDNDGQRQLQWGPHRLNIPADSRPRRGKIKFAVLPQNPLLVKNDRPWGQHLENPVPALVREILTLGGEVLLWLQPAAMPETLLQLRLPERAIRRYPVIPGSQVNVCLRAADIILLED